MDAKDYQDQLSQLMPPGPAWQEEDKLLAAWAEEFARLHAQAEALLREAMPDTTKDMLSEWELDWGLPDPCVGLDATFDDRRARLVTKIRNRSAPNDTYLLNLTRDMGYPGASLNKPQPLRAGFRAQERCFDWEWSYVVIVQLPAVTQIKVMRAGFRAQERLRRWGDYALECVLRRYAMAHIVVLIAYQN